MQMSKVALGTIYGEYLMVKLQVADNEDIMLRILLDTDNERLVSRWPKPGASTRK